MRKQGPARFVKGFFIRERPRDIKARFLGIAHDRPRSPIRVEPRSLRLHEHRNFSLMCGAQHAVCKIVGNQPLVVIGKNQRVEPLERTENQSQ